MEGAAPSAPGCDRAQLSLLKKGLKIGFLSLTFSPMVPNLLDQKILNCFYSDENKGISGLSLSKTLKVSMDEISHRISELQKLGYTIENHPSHGYKLISSPDHLMADDLLARMDAYDSKRTVRTIGNKILIFENTSSTSDVIQKFASGNHPEGLAVFAEEQTSGRGRHGRNWFSPPRKGLWFSILVKPRIEIASFPRLTILSAVAVATALEKITGLEFRVKWPNDVFCNNKKLAGILVELVADSRQIQHAVIGIGINVNLAKEDFPAEFVNRSTSLQIEGGRSFHRPAIAAQILQELDQFYSIIENDEFSYVMENWLRLDCTLGQQVSVKWTDGRSFKGLAANFDPDGALLVRSDDGMMERVTAGEVTLEKI
jgi:BirA family biotin operon repressor/biotin-[acetyl-CoA-carboxylase] ligase